MKHNLVVELYYGGAWHDLTAADEVYTNIVVNAQRFGAWQQTKWNPGTSKMSLMNTDGKYNPENPLSPLYGSLALNMPLRVSADGDVIWTGVAAEWRPGRPLGDARRTELTGGGILRRLGIGLAPITSALMSTILATSPLAYWPLTDDVGASVGASTVPGQPGFDVAPGTIKMSAIDGPDGDRSKLPELASDAVEGVPALTVSPGSSTGDSWSLSFGLWATKTGSTSVITPLVVTAANDSFALTAVWISGSVQQVSFGSGVLSVVNATLDMFDARWHQVTVTMDQTGATATLTMLVDGVSAGSSAATWTPGDVRGITVLSQTTATVGSASIGHIGLWSGAAAPSGLWSAFGGHAGELAHTRFSRLAVEAGIDHVVYGPVDDPGRPMGPQISGRLLDVLWDCVATDGGMAYESASDNELVLKTLGGLYRQDPVLTIDVRTDIVPPLDPLVGDKRIRNDVTASRPHGSSARFEVVTGRFAIADPPTGVGRYDTKIDVNPSSDGLLVLYASWVASHGTVSGVQYETIVLDLDANTTMDTSYIDVGSVIKLVGIPAVDDPTDPRLMITSVEHSIGTHRRTITLGVVSALPWDVEELDTGGYLDCGGTTTNEVLDSTETGVDVLISDACAWTHASGDYGIMIGGERMTVTAVSAVAGTMGARTQTLTVIRSVNGVIKGHATGQPVNVADPIILAL